jgi:hypothetical protein
VLIEYESNKHKRQNKLSDRKRGIIKKLFELEQMCGVFKMMTEGSHCYIYASEDMYRDYKNSTMGYQSRHEERIGFNADSQIVYTLEKVIRGRNVQVSVDSQPESVTPKVTINPRHNVIAYKQGEVERATRSITFEIPQTLSVSTSQLQGIELTERNSLDSQTVVHDGTLLDVSDLLDVSVSDLAMSSEVDTYTHRVK